MFIDAPRAELYDTSSDPAEVRNLAAVRAADASRLRRGLDAAMSPEPAPARTTASSDARDRLRTLGYVTGGGTANPSRRDPKDVAELSVRLGQAIEIEDSDPPKAAALLEGVLRTDPANPLARRHLGIALMRQRRTVDAIRVLNALVTDGDTSAETLGLLADAAIERGNLTEARSRLQTLNVRDPTDTAVALKLGIVLVRAGQIDRAVLLFRGIVDQEPANADALVDLAGALLTSGHAADAAKYFQRAIDNRAEGPLVWNGLAFAKLRSGDRAGAADAFRQSLRIQPDQPDISAALRDLGIP
jgi:predicted Zn-dependent protease